MLSVMSRRRILLCRSPTDGADSLLRLVTRYFNATDSILINLRLKQRVSLPEAVVATTITAVAESNVRPTVARAPRLNRMNRSYEVGLKDMQREAQFSDIMVMGNPQYQALAGEYTAHEATCASLFSCPMLVAPPGEEKVEQIILIDDGEPVTYQQIKHMAYLLPTLCQTTPTTLLITSDQRGYVSAQEEKLWVAYLKLHFAHLAVHRVATVSEPVLSMVGCTKNVLLINPASRFFPPLHRALTPLKQFSLVL